MRRLGLAACALLGMIASAVPAAPAVAEEAVGAISGTNLLATFDTASPGTFTSLKHVTGLVPGERLIGVDYRLHPHNETNPFPGSQLFGVGVVDGVGQDAVRIYTIDPATAAATQIGTGSVPVDDGDTFGMDFNPAADRIRLVNDNDGNVRFNPNSGALSGKDVALKPVGENVTAVAYDRIDIQIPPLVSGNTTLFGVATTTSTLVTIGGVNQNPSPNGGEIMNSKPLGVGVVPGSSAGMDITVGGTAFASLVSVTTGQPGLYTVNLETGAATLIGSLPEALSGFSIVPGSAPVPPDEAAPAIGVKGVKGSMSLAAFLKGIKAKVTPSEPASLDGTLLAGARTAQLSAFNLTLATKSLKLGNGQRTLKLKPNRKLFGKPRHTVKVRLRVTAVDAAGNERTVNRTVKVKPGKSKR